MAVLEKKKAKPAKVVTKGDVLTRFRQKYDLPGTAMASLFKLRSFEYAELESGSKLIDVRRIRKVDETIAALVKDHGSKSYRKGDFDVEAFYASPTRIPTNAELTTVLSKPECLGISPEAKAKMSSDQYNAEAGKRIAARLEVLMAAFGYERCGDIAPLMTKISPPTLYAILAGRIANPELDEIASIFGVSPNLIRFGIDQYKTYDDASSAIGPEMPFSERIKLARAAKGMTLADMASQVNVSYQTVYQWEKLGKLPAPDRMIQLAKVLDLSVGVLTGFDHGLDKVRGSGLSFGVALKEILKMTCFDVAFVVKSTGLRRNQVNSILGTNKEIPEAYKDNFNSFFKTLDYTLSRFLKDISEKSSKTPKKRAAPKKSAQPEEVSSLKVESKTQEPIVEARVVAEDKEPKPANKEHKPEKTANEDAAPQVTGEIVDVALHDPAQGKSGKSNNPLKNPVYKVEFTEYEDGEVTFELTDTVTGYKPAYSGKGFYIEFDKKFMPAPLNREGQLCLEPTSRYRENDIIILKLSEGSFYPVSYVRQQTVEGEQYLVYKDLTRDNIGAHPMSDIQQVYKP